ncbi:MAG: RNA polymerase sigma factor RpoH [Candidatus Dadabacteria bacterium]|nr:RNA polymerase sigma factor RpoH [Candidatus Dadabacteria bacterium]NIQ14648.1 RNA polymerase sigma factor RpoH [Candidatus Dadabacteria bacterium]
MSKKQSNKKQNESRSQALPAITNSLQKYLVEISNNPILSREEEYKLAMQFKEEGDLEAAKKLITSNLKFVVHIANEYKNYGINMMDIIQEGNIGLMRAVKGFDPTKGYRLISYAVWWIRAYIQNHLIKNWSLVKVGTSQAQRKLFYKLRTTKNQLKNFDSVLELEDYSKIAKELGVSDKQVIEMDQRMTTKDLSLDTNIKSDGFQTHMDFLEDESFDQEKLLEKNQVNKIVSKNMQKALDDLKDRERYIIEKRILTDTPQTLEELGKKFNISRERVRQIESSALKKIKKVFKEEGINL